MFKSKLEAIKEKIKAKIKPESTPEEVNELTNLINELDELEVPYNEKVEESAKFKDTIVRMVLEQGNSDKPADDSMGAKPKSIEECVAEELNKK